MSSSSNRAVSASDAVLNIGDRQVGVLRLPINRADDFVEQFNRIYRSVGLQIEVLRLDETLSDQKCDKQPRYANPSKQKILDSDQADEDS